MSSAGFDAHRFKALERAGFNRIAARYADSAHLRARLADALLDAAALEPGHKVLDLASGPGLLARAAALRVQPDGWVLASDIAEEMLVEGARRATEEAKTAGRSASGTTGGDTVESGSNSASRAVAEPDATIPNDSAPSASGSARHTTAAANGAPAGGLAALSFAAADAERLCVGDASFDRVLAGLALFMFPHPDAALAEIRRALRPGGRVVLSVWGVRDEVPLIARAQDCIARLLPAPKVARPSVFRFGDPAVLEAALAAAGFGDVHITPCRFSCTFADAAEYWQAFLDLAGGAAEALARLPDATQQRLRDAVTDELAPHRRPDGAGYAVDAVALVASARA